MGACKDNDTRLGEGEQTNVKADYDMSNHKGDVDSQVSDSVGLDLHYQFKVHLVLPCF
jgi:hypothetical protein